MAGKLQCCDSADEDFIDMEVNSYSNFFYRSGEFEFQMNSPSLEKESTTSPADELFYKGNLLPLHLPPRLEMVEKLLHKEFEETPTRTTTPFQSCNISPYESCQVSRELDPQEYFFEYSTDSSCANGENGKKSWTKKIKLMNQSSLSSKLKASKTYFRSLFGKSSCSAESFTMSTKVADEGSLATAKKNPFGQIHKDRNQMSNSGTRSNDKEYGGHHRRSFSVASKQKPDKKFTSSTSTSAVLSFGSGPSRALQFLKRSSSVSSDIENSIQGAIAHCKQSSQKAIRSRKTISEVGFYYDQERADLCRG